MVLFGERFVYGNIELSDSQKRVAEARARYASRSRALAQEFARTRTKGHRGTLLKRDGSL